MTSYYLGVDIGGTKSHALVADRNGNAIGFGINGAGNHQSVGYEQMVTVMRGIITQALEKAGIKLDQVSGAGFGIAGFDWESERGIMLDSIAQTGVTCPVEVVNDAMIGLVAGAKSGWGVGVVSGTGCNCWGRDANGRIGHVTGYGMSMAEGAGAAELVERAVQAVSLEWSQRGKPTTLSASLITHCGANDLSDLLEGLCHFRYQVDTSFAPEIFRLAETGDEVAGDLIHWAGEQLGSLATGVIRQLDFADKVFEVILIGSLFSNGERLIDPMSEVVHSIAPGAQLVRLEVPPVVGGVLLGMEKTGAPLGDSRRRLTESARELFRN